MEEQLTLMELRGGVPDYDTIYPEVDAWIKTLPTAHRRGAEQIWKEGETKDVIGLCNEYKKAKATAPAAPAAPKAPPRHLSAAAEKAAAKLNVVEGGRTAAVTAPDPNDFDQAWAEATADAK